MFFPFRAKTTMIRDKNKPHDLKKKNNTNPVIIKQHTTRGPNWHEDKLKRRVVTKILTHSFIGHSSESGDY